MALSDANATYLRTHYDNIIQTHVHDEVQASLLYNKDLIINFCIQNDIQLDNIVSLKLADVQRMLEELHCAFLLANEEFKTRWIEEFNQAMLKSQADLTQLHDHAFLSVGDQFRKTGTYSQQSLLTEQDFRDLLDLDSDDIILFEPISLTQHSQEQKGVIRNFVNSYQQETVFIPAQHDGHWFYLLKEQGSWSVQDSQPLTASHELTPRQASMLSHSTALLQELGVPESDVIVFETTGKQSNDYDCGTHVVNAYRKLVYVGYVEKSHQEILEEAFSIQCPELSSEVVLDPDLSDEIDLDLPLAQTSEASEPFTPLQIQVIEATVSTQGVTADKSQNYRDLVSALVRNQSLFSSVINKIDLNDIDNAEKNTEESDEEFAIRLQEAELRRVGLS
jgi:uncharacterized protein YdcH (DUF465 family)